ncbi:hypothetical protein BDW67DRAFT_194497 [Aspergillus spinulosporus]
MLNNAIDSRPLIFTNSAVNINHTFRVLQQFGILDDLLPRGAELNHHLSFTADGHVFSEGDRYSLIRDNHGHGPVAFHRAELIEVMYNGLPDTAREKIFTNKKVTALTTTQNGVNVICADGSVFHGSIVIGADGVYSKTRKIMREIALRDNPHQPWEDPNHPYTATYQLLYGSIPSPSPPGQGYDIQSEGKAIMYFSGPERGWFFLYKRLPSPTRERTNYTDKDVDTLAAEFAEFPLTRTVKVKDVWPRMLGAGLTNLDEGIVKHWSLGRIVLVGDACHKMTTHLGLGFNHGIQDVVVLCNILRRAVKAAPNENPDLQVLTGVFQKYKADRMSSASSLEGDVLKSGLETRMHAWHNCLYYILLRYLEASNMIKKLFMRFVMAPEFRKGQVLDYVAGEERMKGKVSWLHPMKSTL